MNQTNLTDKPSFDGVTYSPELDQSRLTSQLGRVKAFLLEASKYNDWYSLEQIAASTNTPLSTVSSRVRDLRKSRFGGYTIKTKRIGDPKRGYWAYKLEEKPSFTYQENQGILFGEVA